MEQKEFFAAEDINQLIKKYLIKNLKVDVKVEKGYYASACAYIVIRVIVEDEVITEISEQLS